MPKPCSMTEAISCYVRLSVLAGMARHRIAVIEMGLLAGNGCPVRQPTYPPAISHTPSLWR